MPFRRPAPLPSQQMRIRKSRGDVTQNLRNFRPGDEFLPKRSAPKRSATHGSSAMLRENPRVSRNVMRVAETPVLRRIFGVLPVSLQLLRFCRCGRELSGTGRDRQLSRGCHGRHLPSQLKACRACHCRISRRTPADRTDPGADSAWRRASCG